MVVLCAFGVGNESFGYRGGGDIRPWFLEYHSSVHCDPPNTGDVSGGGVVAGNMGGMAVVGSGQDCPQGRKGSGRSGRGGVGGGGKVGY